MFLSWLMLLVALSLSVIAAFYSIAGLAAIFAAAVIPIIVMGSILEVAKLVVTVWLHEYWSKCRFLMKVYLVPAVVLLAFITSMGIFGFLSKAHSDQGMVSGDVQAKIAIYDEKIKIERENIDANRKALKQLDEAVDQVMGRSTDEKGADKAVAIRRGQQAERGRLLKEIGESQKRIAALNEERAPIAAEVRKVEAEVGPIKYIAALVYGDNPDANILERAVRWVIIILVIVFDPLAIMMLLASTESFKWERELKNSSKEPAYEQDDGPLSEDQIEQVQETAPEPAEPVNKFAYLFKGDFWKKPEGWFSVGPMVAKTETETTTPIVEEATTQTEPGSTKPVRTGFLGLQADNELPQGTNTSFGIHFPVEATKGDTFVRVDFMPNRVYRFNGKDWLFLDKNFTDHYTFNTDYIDYLISKISTGEYDTDLLSDSEREQVTLRLKSTSNS